MTKAAKTVKGKMHYSTLAKQSKQRCLLLYCLKQLSEVVCKLGIGFIHPDWDENNGPSNFYTEITFVRYVTRNTSYVKWIDNAGFWELI